VPIPEKSITFAPKLGKYGEKKMALQVWRTTHGTGQAHNVFGE
jgi:hypothetical protein